MDFASTSTLANDRQSLSQVATPRVPRSLVGALRVALGALALALVMHVGHGTAHAQGTSLFCALFPSACPVVAPPPCLTPPTAVPELDPSASAGGFALLVGGAAVLLGGRRRAA